MAMPMGQIEQERGGMCSQSTPASDPLAVRSLYGPSLADSLPEFGSLSPPVVPGPLPHNPVQ